MTAGEQVEQVNPTAAGEGALELSVIMPCLNEAESVGQCVEKARRAMEEIGIAGEVIVADNGSTDGSRQIAERAGARVISVRQKGYGHALMGGIAAARGRLVVMGDADDSYDFAEIPRFVEKLRQGYELVQGSRLPAGGGSVMPGAMPALHRWWGNPMFSLLARWWFGAPIHDVYCGLRGFTKDFYRRLDLHCAGMEFATEMIIKASLRRARIAEVPVTLYPDRRTAHGPHLRTFRDGWRTLRFFMLYSPRWLFLYPGLLLMLLGVAVGALIIPGPRRIGRVNFDVHTLLYAAAAVVIGFQAVAFALFAKTFAVSEGLLPEDPKMKRLLRWFSLEGGLIVGLVLLLGGIGLTVFAFAFWGRRQFGNLDPFRMLRIIVPAVTFLTMGFQVVMASFFLGVLGMKRK